MLKRSRRRRRRKGRERLRMKVIERVKEIERDGEEK
jgi:hypothetical protein